LIGQECSAPNAVHGRGRRHGISRGQFYAWRQQLLLAGALDAAAAALTSPLSIEVPTTGPGEPLACVTAPACAVLGTPVNCLPAQPEDFSGVVRSVAVAPTANDASGADDAASRDRSGVFSSPGGAAADRAQVEHVNRRHLVTPPVLATSVICDADRRQEPTPMHTIGPE
jgi:hypothetical protein